MYYNGKPPTTLENAFQFIEQNAFQHPYPQPQLTYSTDGTQSAEGEYSPDAYSPYTTPHEYGQDSTSPEAVYQFAPESAYGANVGYMGPPQPLYPVQVAHDWPQAPDRHLHIKEEVSYGVSELLPSERMRRFREMSSLNYPVEARSVHVCGAPRCDKKFARPEHLSRHRKTAHDPNPHIDSCPYCNRRFVMRPDNFRTHILLHARSEEEAKNARTKPCAGAREFFNTLLAQVRRRNRSGKPAARAGADVTPQPRAKRPSSLRPRRTAQRVKKRGQ